MMTKYSKTQKVIVDIIASKPSLESCPFCGNYWPTLSYNGYGDYWEFECPQCGLKCSFGPASASIRCGNKDAAKERAIEHWNTRAVCAKNAHTEACK